MIAVLQPATTRQGGEWERLTQYVAVDVGKRKCVTCVMDQDGRISEISSYSNTSFDAYRFTIADVDGFTVVNLFSYHSDIQIEVVW